MFDQEPVVPELRHNQLHTTVGNILPQDYLFGDREDNIRGNSDYQCLGLDALQSLFYTAPSPTDIVRVEGFGDTQVGVEIESPTQFQPLVPLIGAGPESICFVRVIVLLLGRVIGC